MSEPTPWYCAMCGQKNAGWSLECGRCNTPRPIQAAPQSAEGEAAPKPKWYITTGVKMENGARLRGHGPYATREEAMEERTKLEQTTSATYWVEELDEA